MSEFKPGQLVRWRVYEKDSFAAGRIKHYGPGPFLVVEVKTWPKPAFCDCGAVRQLSSGQCCLPQHEPSCAMYRTPPDQITISTVDGPREFSADLFEPVLEENHER